VNHSVTVVAPLTSAALVGDGGIEGAGASLAGATAATLTGATTAAFEETTGDGAAFEEAAAGALYDAAGAEAIGFDAVPEIMTSKQVDHCGASL